ncbi:MAG: EAL domain-containing protein [Kluyvera sp.]|uniref:EAL domain-containing protein n=1 Tax=Kluyvera sp. TaxID=1538228 RepID=UPI003A879F39
MMTTQRLVSLITGVLIILIVLPITLSLWLAHRQAHELFDQELNAYAERVVARSERVRQQTRAALEEVSRFEGETCSVAHLRMLQKVSYIHQYVQSVFYLDNASHPCAMLNNPLAEKVPGSEFIAPGGYQVWLISRHDLQTDDKMMAVSNGHYMAVVDPDSLIDVLPHPDYPIHAALISEKDHQVLASNVPLDRDFWLKNLHYFTSELEKDGTVYRQQHLPTVGAILLTWSSQQPLESSLHRQLAMWVPLGILLSVFAAFLMLRLLRRLRSSHYRILDAIQAKEITVHYQPVVDLQSGRIVGAEALARWQQPDGNWLAPDIFIPLAEQTGVINQLTEYIICSVFDDLGDWLATHPQQHISINFAAADLCSTPLPALLQQKLTQWQVAPKQIAIEITERELVTPKTACPVIQAYREIGHTIYIDDFGVGYSSLSYLQDLDVDTLKIDKSFVDTLGHNPVTEHIIAMAKSLALTMVAEGIETTAQRDWLLARGVQSGQGWLYSPALPKTEFIHWANDNLQQHPR